MTVQTNQPSPSHAHSAINSTPPVSSACQFHQPTSDPNRHSTPGMHVSQQTASASYCGPPSLPPCLHSGMAMTRRCCCPHPCAADDAGEVQDTADSSDSSDTSGCSCHRTSHHPRPALQHQCPASAATAAAAKAGAATAEEDGGVTSPRRPAPAAVVKTGAAISGARADVSSLYCWEVLQLSLDDM